MTAPTRPPLPRRPVRRRRFDLRSTAFFFALLALLISLGGLAVRTAAAAAERHPAWAAALLLLTAAAVAAGHRGRRRWSARRLVRRATETLEEAAETAADALDTAPPGPHGNDVNGVNGGAWDAVPEGPHNAGPTAATVPLRDHLTYDETLVVTPDPGPAQPPAGATVIGVGALEELEPAAFEEAIADLCVRDGCADVEVVGGAGDLGADVLAVAPDGRRVVIQCKRYADGHKVGSQDMQRFGGTCFTVHAADVAVVVTTSDFTAPAAEYAEQCGIVCVDAERLGEWRSGTGPRPWEPRHAEDRTDG
ncbi:restriction endonuclease [Streptomyces sp. NPDC014995]|uniref:restriction endonuclease n=1 Tax=Streptomyces sp. NPDC014995 TaxID=3364936 RepID=UPI0036F61D1F